MGGAAIVQAAYSNGVQVVILRFITDQANVTARASFDHAAVTNESKNSIAELIETFIQAVGNDSVNHWDSRQDSSIKE